MGKDASTCGRADKSVMGGRESSNHADSPSVLRSLTRGELGMLGIVAAGDLVFLCLGQYGTSALYLPPFGVIGDFQGTLAHVAADVAFLALAARLLLSFKGGFAQFAICVLCAYASWGSCYLPYLMVSSRPAALALAAALAALLAIVIARSLLRRKGVMSVSHRPFKWLCILPLAVICACSLASGWVFGLKSTPTSICTSDLPEPASLEEASLDSNREIVLSFWDGGFEKMTLKEKADALAVLARAEARSLGLLHQGSLDAAPEVRIVQDTSPTAAALLREDNAIIVSVACVSEMPPDMIVQTICHETFHAFQYELAFCSGEERRRLEERSSYSSALGEDKAAAWRAEFVNYDASASEDGTGGYYGQQLEIDAFRFALSRVLKIKEHCGLPTTVEVSASQLNGFDPYLSSEQ